MEGEFFKLGGVNIADLSSCDEELIHIPNSIQPHAYLMAVNQATGIVEVVSENIGQILYLPPEKILGKTAMQILGRSFFNLINDLTAKYPDGIDKPMHIGYHYHDAKRFDMLVHTRDSRYIIELEEHTDTPMTASLDRLGIHQQTLHSAKSIPDLLRSTVEELKRITEYDRVMIYQFHPDFHGEVVAEAKNKDLPSFLGLHYPSSDIPPQARELYLTNWTRVIPSIQYSPIHLIQIVKKPIDLSHAYSRSVSPLHIEYLTNMGVGATLVISLIFEGKLWGLIACHHYSPKYVNYQVRDMSELLGRLLSLYIPFAQNEDRKRMMTHLQSVGNQIAEWVREGQPLETTLLGAATDLLELFKADGMTFYTGDTWHSAGTVLPTEALQILVQAHQMQAPDEDVFLTDQLSQHFPQLAQARMGIEGVLMINLFKNSHQYIVFYRLEYIHKINWAGKPEKNIIVAEQGARLSPRKSFEKFEETVKGKSRPWLPEKIERLKELKNILLDALLWKQQEETRLLKNLFQSVYNQSPDAIFLVNKGTYDMADCNHTAMRMFELDSKEQLQGVFGDAMHTKPLAEEEKIALLQLFLNRGYLELEFEYQTFKGNGFWGELSARKMEGESNPYFLVRIRDISERKEYQQMLEKSNEELNNLNKELDRMMYSVSHDLRSPVSALMGLVKVWEDNPEHIPVQHLMQFVKSGLIRMETFIAEILSYSRNASTELRISEIHIETFLKDIAHSLQHSVADHPIHLHFDLPEGGGILSDPFRLGVIFNNLIGNSVKYHDPDKPTIELTCKLIEKDGMYTIFLEDNGKGINAEHLPKIFDMFYRADSTQPGSGLGLYLVKQAVEKLGGTISIASEEGVGTRFTLQLPKPELA